MNYACQTCGEDFTSDDVMMAYSSSVECCPNCGSSDFCERDGGEGGICQCCSCEGVFKETDLMGGVCPHCGSGNWIWGYIDEPEISNTAG